MNFFGAVRCIQRVLPHMKQNPPDPAGVRGQIVNVGSVLGLFGAPRHAAYCASKFAIRGLSESLRLELRDSGIDVILVEPGYTETPFFENEIRYAKSARSHPIRGMSPEKSLERSSNLARIENEKSCSPGPGNSAPSSTGFLRECWGLFYCALPGTVNPIPQAIRPRAWSNVR